MKNWDGFSSWEISIKISEDNILITTQVNHWNNLLLISEPRTSKEDVKGKYWATEPISFKVEDIYVLRKGQLIPSCPNALIKTLDVFNQFLFPICMSNFLLQH